MTWDYEHGEEYQVPREITEKLRDISWHNDVCPSFAAVEPLLDPCGDEHDLRLWVDHPDQDQRSYGVRFCVNYNCWSCVPVPGVSSNGDDDLYAGDDVTEALAAFAEVAGVIASELRKRRTNA